MILIGFDGYGCATTGIVNVDAAATSATATARVKKLKYCRFML
jgi:hypothetical protein